VGIKAKKTLRKETEVETGEVREGSKEGVG
jgi:hypothetical protein